VTTFYQAIPWKDHYEVHEQVNGEVRRWVVTTDATGEPLITLETRVNPLDGVVLGCKPFDWSDTTTSNDGQTTLSRTSPLGRQIMSAIAIRQRDQEISDAFDRGWAKEMANADARARGEPEPYPDPPPSVGEVLRAVASAIPGRYIFFAVLLIMILFTSGWAATWDLVLGIFTIWAILSFILWVSGENRR
jgi:hypothetical protein